VEAILDEAIAVYAGGGQDTRKGIVRAVLRDVKRGVRRLEGGDA
jgi:hypothetical protein